MEFEDDFGIPIPGAAAEQMRTVGQTVAFIVQRLAETQSPTGVCATQRSFYKLRRQLVERFGVARDRVKPGAPIGNFLPPRSGREWEQIAEISGLRREPRFLFMTPTPPPEMSIREVIASRCRATWRRFDGTIDEAAVLQRILVIVSEQMGVRIEDIGPETRYVEDLGI